MNLSEASYRYAKKISKHTYPDPLLVNIKLIYPPQECITITADEKQQQGEAAGDVLRAWPS